MTTLQTDIQKLKSFLLAKRKEWDVATGGPWTADECNVLGIEKWSPASCLNGPSVEQKKHNALCIASSRTLTPLLIDTVLGEVEWLEEQMDQDWENHHYTHYDRSKNRLTAILNQWRHLYE